MAVWMPTSSRKKSTISSARRFKKTAPQRDLAGCGLRPRRRRLQPKEVREAFEEHQKRTAGRFAEQEKIASQSAAPEEREEDAGRGR